MSYEENNNLEQENQAIPNELLVKFKNCFEISIYGEDIDVQVDETIQGGKLFLLLVSKIKKFML
jgi:hypothetical protein